MINSKSSIALILYSVNSKQFVSFFLFVIWYTQAHYKENNMKFLVAVMTTLYLWDIRVLKSPVNAGLFFFGLMLVWAAWWILTTRRIYEQNMGLIQTVSDSVPKSDPIHLEIASEKRSALRAAIRGIRWVNTQ